MRVTAVIRTAARQLTGADGPTFVLRDGNHCHYFDEDAIARSGRDFASRSISASPAGS